MLSSSAGEPRARLLQLDERKPVVPRLVLGLLLIRRGGWLRRRCGLRRLRRWTLLRRERRGAAGRRRGLGLIQPPVVHAAGCPRGPSGALHPLAGDAWTGRWRSDGPPILGDREPALAFDAHRDVLAVDDDPLQHRVLLRRLQPLEQLREALLPRRVRGQVRALAGLGERQHALDHIGGEQLRAELDQLLARHRPQPGAQIGRDLGGRIQIPALAAHDPISAGSWQPMVVAPEKSAPVSAASRRSTPIKVARAKEAPIRFAPRIETSIRRAPVKSAFSIEAAPSLASAKAARTISAPSNRARYSLVSSKRATARVAPENTAFIASQPWNLTRRALIWPASSSLRSQK